MAIPEQVRFWIYSVTTALVPILIAYGVVDNETAPLWVALAAAVLGTGTAALNTSPKNGGKHRVEIE